MKGHQREYLWSFTNEAIADDILVKLKNWQLQLEFLRGQAYNGAEAVAGKSKGAAACVTAKQPKAFYTHCASHRLNLCVVKCCSIRKLALWCSQPMKFHNFLAILLKDSWHWKSGLMIFSQMKDEKGEGDVLHTLDWVIWSFWKFLRLSCVLLGRNSQQLFSRMETRSNTQLLFLTMFRFFICCSFGVYTENVIIHQSTFCKTSRPLCQHRSCL